MKLKDIHVIILFSVIVLGISLYINLLPPTDLGFLTLRSVDEQAFMESLFFMWEGWTNLEIKQSLSFGFYAYGWIFWLIPGILAFPFYLMGNDLMIILTTRMVSAIFGLLTIIFVYKILNIKLNKLYSLLIASTLLLMPGFWENAFWFHPDHMMVFFGILSFYFLAKDNLNFGRFFRLGVLSGGIGLGSKLTMLMFIPVFGFYIFYGWIRHYINFNKAFIYGISTFGVIGGTYIIMNPYFLHPAGFERVKEQFLKDMKSNKTNHGKDPSSVTPLSKYEKTIKKYYGHLIFIMIMIILGFILSYKEIKNNDKNIISTLSLFWVLLSLGYLLLNVSKEWQHYYLFPFMFLPLLLGGINNLNRKYVNYFIIILFIAHFSFNITNIKNTFSRYLFLMNTKESQYYKDLATEINILLQNEDINTIAHQLSLPLNHKSLGIKFVNKDSKGGIIKYEHIIGTPKDKYHNIPDILIFDKTTPLLNKKNDIEYKNWSNYESIIEGRKFIEEIKNGKIFNKNGEIFKYNLFYENDKILILKYNITKGN